MWKGLKGQFGRFSMAVVNGFGGAIQIALRLTHDHANDHLFALKRSEGSRKGSSEHAMLDPDIQWRILMTLQHEASSVFGTLGTWASNVSHIPFTLPDKVQNMRAYIYALKMTGLSNWANSRSVFVVFCVLGLFFESTQIQAAGVRDTRWRRSEDFLQYVRLAAVKELTSNCLS